MSDQATDLSGKRYGEVLLVTRGEAGGIWGGMSEEDRHTITRGQKA